MGKRFEKTQKKQKWYTPYESSVSFFKETNSKHQMRKHYLPIRLINIKAANYYQIGNLPNVMLSYLVIGLCIVKKQLEVSSQQIHIIILFHF